MTSYYLHAADDAAGVDLGGVERLLEVDHGTCGLDHGVLLVVLYEVGEGVEAVAATRVVLVVHAADHHVGDLM